MCYDVWAYTTRSTGPSLVPACRPMPFSLTLRPALAEREGGATRQERRHRTCPRVVTTPAPGGQFWLGPPLYHPSPVGAVTFSRDGRELTAAVRSGRLYRWPLPEPMSGTAAECERTLETWLGITYTNGDGVLLAPEAWTARGRP